MSDHGQTRFLTRRSLLRSSAILGGALALPALPAWSQAKVAGGRPVKLTQFVWVGAGQGVVPREINTAYEKANPNVSVALYESSNAVTFPKMVAQRAVDPKNPLINFGFFSGEILTKGGADKMFVPLDPKKIPNMANVFDNMLFGGGTGVGFATSGVGLIYNKKAVAEAPTSWLDIFAPRFKGKVMLFDYSWLVNGLYGVACALRKPGETAPAIDAAFERFSKAASDGQFLATYNANEQLKTAMARGDALISAGQLSFGIKWNDDQPGTFAYAVPSEGSLAYVGYLAIVDGSTQDQIDVASDIINTTLQAENVGKYCNLTALAPTVRNVSLKPELAQEAQFSPAVTQKAIIPDFDLIAKNDAQWRQRWDREVKARMK